MGSANEDTLFDALAYAGTRLQEVKLENRDVREQVRVWQRECKARDEHIRGAEGLVKHHKHIAEEANAAYAQLEKQWEKYNESRGNAMMKINLAVGKLREEGDQTDCDHPLVVGLLSDAADLLDMRHAADPYDDEFGDVEDE